MADDGDVDARALQLEYGGCNDFNIGQPFADVRCPRLHERCAPRNLDRVGHVFGEHERIEQCERESIAVPQLVRYGHD